MNNSREKPLEYRKNIEAFEEKYGIEIEKQIEEHPQEKIFAEIEVKTGYIGQKILRVTEQNGQKKFLAGKFEPQRPILDWLERQGKVEHETVFAIEGIGNIWQLAEVMETVDKEVAFLVYEPCRDIFLKVLSEYDIADLIKEDKLFIVVDGINEKELENVLNTSITIDNMALTQVYISDNYSELFSEKTKKFLSCIKMHVENTVVTRNTVVRYTDVVARNVLNNVAYWYHGYSVEQLKEFVPDGVPAFIISAGPSLNKNIQQLKRAQGKSLIIATDTAVRPLLINGIQPDFAVVVDGKKPATLMDCPGTEKVALVTCVSVSDNYMNRHHGKKFFYYSGEAYELEMMRYIGEKDRERAQEFGLINLPTGGSVANTAFSLAHYVGCKTIVLVGQDLALEGTNVYADNTFQHTQIKINETDTQYQIDGIYGGKVTSRSDFVLYLQWFEKEIKRLQEDGIRVIDATEGGALIHGTEIKTLAETIDELCNQKVMVQEKFLKMPEYFNETEKQAMLEYFGKTRTDIQRAIKKAEEGKKYYKEMLKLCTQKELNIKKYKDISRKAGKINHFIDTDPAALFVISTMQELEMELRTRAYITKDDEKEERMVIAKNAEMVLEEFVKSAQKILDMLSKSLEQYNGDDELLYARYSQEDSVLIK